MANHTNERDFHTTTSAYSLPNDAPEHMRLEKQSSAIIDMLGGRTVLTNFPPEQSPLKVIDIGCGTGVVTSHMSIHWPSAEVIGLDLSPIPSNLRQKSANLKFVQGDIMTLAGDQATNLEHATFDFVFSRLLLAGIPDWPAYVQTCFSMLKPGGWFESQEMSFRWHKFDERGNETEISTHWDWLDTMLRSGMAKSLDFRAGEKLSQNFEKAGFVDVSISKYKWMWSFKPIDAYPECTAIGQYSVEYMNPIALVLMTKLCAETEHKAMEKDMEATVGQLGNGEWQDYWVVRGRKPS